MFDLYDQVTGYIAVRLIKFRGVPETRLAIDAETRSTHPKDGDVQE